MTYTIILNTSGQPNGMIMRSDGLQIPPDLKNVDYKEYLAWIALGNIAK